MTAEKKGGEMEKIKTSIVATNIVASRPPMPIKINLFLYAIWGSNTSIFSTEYGRHTMILSANMGDGIQ